MQLFIEERLNTNDVSFFSPTKKLNLKTFSSMGTKTKKSESNAAMRLAMVNEDRQLFSRIVVVAKTRNVKLKTVFVHELSSVPYALAHVDGTLRKATKSILLSELEKRVSVIGTLPGGRHTTWIIDGMAVLQMVGGHGASTFGELSDCILQIVLKPFKSGSCFRIDVVFDCYNTDNSIKSFERARRKAGDSIELRITNQSTPLPKDWKRFMSSSKNKENLKNFLCEKWCKDVRPILTAGQVLIIAGGFSDSAEARAIKMQQVTSLTHLRSTHEEADTRILLHAADASMSTEDIVVWSPDTDVAVLCCHYVRRLNVRLYFRTGVKDKARFIPIHEVAESLGEDICRVLSILHCLTGCDSMSGLYGIGKTKALKWAVTNEDAIQLAEIGVSINIPESAVEACTKCVCQLYDAKYDGKDINELRLRLFCKKQARNEELPPTEDSFRHHIERVNYQCMIWKHSLVPQPDIPTPIGNGWEINEGVMVPVLMTLEPAPKALMEIITCHCKISKCKGRCSCSAEGLICTAACICEGEENCCNPHKHSEAVSRDSEESSDED